MMSAAGAVRNARPPRGQAAAHLDEGTVEGRREAINFAWTRPEWQVLFY